MSRRPRIGLSGFSRALMVLVVCGGCASDPAPAPRSVFSFAREVTLAEADFDRLAFRSFRKDGTLSARVSMDATERRFALVPPVPSRLTYEISIPENPWLTFAIGIASLDERPPPAPVEFRIVIDAGSGDEIVFSDIVRRRFTNQWFDRDVDVGPWAGRRVRLTLETRYQTTDFTPDEADLAGSGHGFLAAWANPVLTDRARAGSRPDLILISIDCLRADHVSAYGYRHETTPTLDALARDGVVFEDVVSVSSWTLPTHMSMLTGLLPTEHGLRQDQRKLPSAPYLPEILAESGYETVGIISSLLLTPTFGFDEGFDRYHALVDEPAADLVDTAIDEMTRPDGRSRFLFLHLFDAHWPYDPPSSLVTRFGERLEDISDSLQKVIERKPPSGPDEVQGLKNLYDAEVFEVDRELGRLIAAIRDAGRYDDALIIVTADHGEGFYEHGFWQHSEVIYSEVTQIPLIVKWPGGARRGRDASLVDQLRIFPTILDVASIPTADARPGLASEVETPALTEITWEGNENRGATMKVAIRKGALKYVATFEGDPGDPDFVSRLVKEELYDRSRDPGEHDDLFPRADAESFRSDARAFIEKVRLQRSVDPARAIVLDEATRERLRALGYVDP